MDLMLSKPSELLQLLRARLRQERLAQQMTQAEVVARAGIGVNTLSNMENGKNVGFETIIRTAMVLGRAKELEALFKPKLESLDDLLRYESSSKRHRAPRQPK